MMMMDEIEIWRREELLAGIYPAAAEGFLSEEAADLDPALVWGRIEDYTSYRWSPRQVVWTVTGPGEFVPDLRPCTIVSHELWIPSAWVTTIADPSPLGGFQLDRKGPFRFTGLAGENAEIPPGVWEAYRRLAEYMAERPEKSGVSRYSVNVADIGEEVERSAKWVAQAMQLSGAADLLRAYRRA